MTEQTSKDVDGTVEISDLHEFVTMLTAWHEFQVKVLNHLKEIPEGTQVSVDDTPFELSGDTHTAFVLGIQMSLEQLGVLPFVPEYEDTVSVEPVPNAS